MICLALSPAALHAEERSADDVPGSAPVESPRASAPTVLLHFTGARKGRPYRVTVGELSCEMPCTLSVPAEYTWFKISGPLDYRQELLVPEGSAVIHVENENAKVFHTGLGLFFGGLGFMAAGTLLAIDTALVGSPFGRATDAVRGVALTMVALGFIGAAVGSPLIAMQGKNHLIMETVGKPEPDADRLRLLGVGLSVLPRAAAAQVAWSF